MGINRLGDSQSSYLKQHANNPIDWWPWCDDAFLEAKNRDVPVFLSIGYSACHWCHVMAHETFEDVKVAKFMNENYVCIKVDREEHPDVDAVYMEAIQSMTGSGGWPMSVFLDPSGVPFYGGTYFPPHEGTSLPSFTRVIEELAKVYRHSRPEIAERGKAVLNSLQIRGSVPLIEGQSTTLNYRTSVQAFIDTTLKAVDNEWGGIGRAPKFLQPHLWISVLDLYQMTGNEDLISALTLTLDSVISGGIYDQVGGGFARYSTDSFWMVPHFEKMLYDQAQNARLFLRALLVTNNEFYGRAAIETINFVLRELRRDDGLFCSSFDADTEGQEGLFYLFDLEELKRVVGEADLEEFCQTFGATKGGNFEGQNILHRPKRGDLSITSTMENAIQKLYDYRLARFLLPRDDKAVVEWNAMFITTLAEAGFYLDRQDYLIIANQAFEALYQKANFGLAGQRVATNDPETQAPPAIFADYVQMLGAALALAQYDGSSVKLESALSLYETIITEFYDPETKRFFTTANSSKHLVVRPTELFDSAYGSSNAYAVQNFFLLGHLTNNPEIIKTAKALLDSFAQLVSNHPHAFPILIAEIAKQELGIIEIAIPKEQSALLQVAKSRYLPSAIFTFNPSTPDETWAARKDQFAYVCRNSTCFAPTDSPDVLSSILEREFTHKLY